MRKIILTEWVSIDGFTSGPDNDMGFVSESYSDEMSTYEDNIVSQSDTLLLGRLTYDSSLAPGRMFPTNPTSQKARKPTLAK